MGGAPEEVAGLGLSLGVGDPPVGGFEVGADGGLVSGLGGDPPEGDDPLGGLPPAGEPPAGDSPGGFPPAGG